MEKLEIMIKLASDRNIDQVQNQFFFCCMQLLILAHVWLKSKIIFSYNFSLLFFFVTSYNREVQKSTRESIPGTVFQYLDFEIQSLNLSNMFIL